MMVKVVVLLGLLLCLSDMRTEAFSHYSSRLTLNYGHYGQITPSASNSPCSIQITQSSKDNSRQTTKTTKTTNKYSRKNNKRSKSMTMSAFPLEDAVLIEHSSIGKKAMRWDDTTKSFQQYALSGSVKQTPLLNFFKNCFVPSGVISSDYYKYSLWRSAQRFVSATSSVFGTQALLLALGFKSNRIGIAAATTWVLKDALGKISRIFWASKHGRKFDSDAKKWRFRSSILFATGNGLEIFTYIVPSMFLLTAALANALKQMAMLTSSATRNTIYKSFARSSDNIGDITAKGEAQIAVIDLLGMTTGVLISRAIGASRSKITGIFLGLSIFDLICIYNEIKSVIFTTLNFERTNLVLTHLFSEAAGRPFSTIIKENEDEEKIMMNIKKTREVEKGDVGLILENTDNKSKLNKIMQAASESDSDDNDSSDSGEGKIDEKRVVRKDAKKAYIRPIMQSLTPIQVAVSEPILLPTRFGEEIFRSWSTVECSPKTLRGAMDLFAGQPKTTEGGKIEGGEQPGRFIITLDARLPRSWVDAKRAEIGWSSGILRAVEGVPIILTPQILLHYNATQFDVFRASFIVRKILHEFKSSSVDINVTSVGAKLQKLGVENADIEEYSRNFLETANLGCDGLLSMIENAKNYEKKNMRDCINLLRTAGWDVSKFTFGTLRTRVEW